MSKTTYTTIHQPNGGVVRVSTTTHSNGDKTVRQTQVVKGK
jgi:hypothetical protein